MLLLRARKVTNCVAFYCKRSFEAFLFLTHSRLRAAVPKHQLQARLAVGVTNRISVFLFFLVKSQGCWRRHTAEARETLFNPSKVGRARVRWSANSAPIWFLSPVLHFLEKINLQYWSWFGYLVFNIYCCLSVYMFAVQKPLALAIRKVYFFHQTSLHFLYISNPACWSSLRPLAYFFPSLLLFARLPKLLFRQAHGWLARLARLSRFFLMRWGVRASDRVMNHRKSAVSIIFSACLQRSLPITREKKKFHFWLHDLHKEWRVQVGDDVTRVLKLRKIFKSLSFTLKTSICRLQAKSSTNSPPHVT